MPNKMMKFLVVSVMAVFAINAHAAIDDVLLDEEMEDISAAAIADYDVTGSPFEQIVNLEQEKILMQLEKERAQLDLELDRLAAEKIKLHMEIDTLSGRAEAQQAELETEKAKLEAEAARLAREKAALESEEYQAPEKTARRAAADREEVESTLAQKYKLINVIGAGNQLQATVVDLNSGQNKRISVGKTLDGFTVKSISLDDGVVLVKGGETQTLNVSGNN